MQCFKATTNTIFRSFVMAAVSSYLRTSVTLLHRPLSASRAILLTVCLGFADSVRCVRVDIKRKRADCTGTSYFDFKPNGHKN